MVTNKMPYFKISKLMKTYLMYNTIQFGAITLSIIPFINNVVQLLTLLGAFIVSILKIIDWFKKRRNSKI